MITVGADLGTAAIKVVFVEGHNVLWAKACPTLPRQAEACGKLIDDGLAALSIKKDKIEGVAVTGYGRRLFIGAKKIVDEISANAVGTHVLSDKKARTVINVGGQDVKIIRISPDGKAEDFKMNDKCAAGTGRFFEMAGRILNASVQDLGELGLTSRSPVDLNCTCAVFAETEIVSLLSAGRDRNDIIAGLHRAVAKRISELAYNFHIEEEIYLDGGPALNKDLFLSVQEELMRDVRVLPHPQFTVAFGAAVSLSDKGA